VILHFNYEELTALKAGAQVFLDRESPADGSVLAPPESRARVEALVPMLDGDLSLSNLEELRQVKAAVDSIVQCLRVEMETTVVTTHAADEIAVSAYFDFAHGFTVSHRIGEMAAEMEALIELVTGGEATTETARTFHFPD
jgi:deoxycytidylate deaminase